MEGDRGRTSRERGKEDKRKGSKEEEEEDRTLGPELGNFLSRLGELLALPGLRRRALPGG